MSSLETVTEMLRTLKEEQLPAMREEICNRLDKQNGYIFEHTKQIDSLEKFRAEHAGQYQTVKYFVYLLFGVAGIVIGVLKI